MGSSATEGLAGAQIGSEAGRRIRLCTDELGMAGDMLLWGSVFVAHAGKDGVCARCGVEF